MRISDWSSDVCSSDLIVLTAVVPCGRDTLTLSNKAGNGRRPSGGSEVRSCNHHAPPAAGTDLGLIARFAPSAEGIQATAAQCFSRHHHTSQSERNQSTMLKTNHQPGQEQ